MTSQIEILCKNLRTLIEMLESEGITSKAAQLQQLHYRLVSGDLTAIDSLDGLFRGKNYYNDSAPDEIWRYSSIVSTQIDKARSEMSLSDRLRVLGPRFLLFSSLGVIVVLVVVASLIGAVSHAA